MSAQSQPQDLQVGLWGSKSSGKTTYLAVLSRVLKLGGWELKPVDAGSQEFLSEVEERIFQDRRFPAPTPPDKARTYRYWISPPQRLRLPWQPPRRYTLALLDVSGEAFENPRQYRELYPSVADVYDYLKGCRGIIFLLDPSRPKPAPNRPDEPAYCQIISRAFFELAQRLDPTQPVRIPAAVAFCLAKMDAPQHYPHREQPREYAAEILGALAMMDIKDYCERDRYDFFCCSAIGVRQNELGYASPNFTPRDDGVEEIDVAHLSPFGMLEPLKWILRKVAS